MLQVLLLCFTPYEDIIEVDACVVDTLEDMLNESCKG